MTTLENHYRDLCDIEFTIERGKLWMLQTRVGKRTAAAAFRIAIQLVDEGLIDMDEALRPGHRRPARAADVPPLRRRRGEVKKIAKGDQRLAGRRGRQGRLRLRDAPCERAGAGRGGHPGPPGDQPRRPARHDRRPGHPDQPRRQDQPRRRRRPRHGQDLRLRRGRARGRRGRAGQFTAPGGVDGQRGRRHLDRRHVRRRLPRRGAGRALPGRAVLRGQPRPGRPTSWSAPSTGIMQHADATRRLGVTDQRRHRRGRRPGPPVRRRRASACAAPSTCSSASAASWSSG